VLYQNRVFTCPANTAKISKELWAYRLGLIDEKEYHRLTGQYPDSPENGQEGSDGS
jgi:hypothetical protein